jgi:GxxExxY protein
MNALTGIIIGAAIEVHRILGPGLLESAYQACLAFELKERGMKIDRQVELPLYYKLTLRTEADIWTEAKSPRLNDRKEGNIE